MQFLEPTFIASLASLILRDHRSHVSTQTIIYADSSNKAEITHGANSHRLRQRTIALIAAAAMVTIGLYIYSQYVWYSTAVTLDTKLNSIFALASAIGTLFLAAATFVLASESRRDREERSKPNLHPYVDTEGERTSLCLVNVGPGAAIDVEVGIMDGVRKTSSYHLDYLLPEQREIVATLNIGNRSLPQVWQVKLEYKDALKHKFASSLTDCKYEP